MVIAKAEYEAWFVAAAASLAGRRGLVETLTPPQSPEHIRDAKGWLSAHMPRKSYREVLDQPALSAVFDMKAALVAPSFGKLWRDVSSLLLGV